MKDIILQNVLKLARVSLFLFFIMKFEILRYVILKIY
jgi:hypothetical protein